MLAVTQPPVGGKKHESPDQLAVVPEGYWLLLDEVAPKTSLCCFGCYQIATVVCSFFPPQP